MESKYVVITTEEYKELLTFKLRAEIESEYKEKIEDLNLQIQALENDVANEKELSTFWWKKCKEAEKGGEAA